MRPEDLFGLWPAGAVVAAAFLRVLEHAILADATGELSTMTRRDRVLLELLTSAAQALVVAGGVGFALLFGRRLGL